MKTQCLISFGSNLGDRNAILAEAATRIDRSGIVQNRLRTSRLFETPAIGGPGGQPPFLNAVAAMETEATAAEVLDVLQQIELELGRARDIRWGARVVDLDVVLHGCLSGESVAGRSGLGRRGPGRRGLIGGRGPAGSPKALVVPHPRYPARRFVLQPACDVAADFCDPRFGWTIAELSNHLDAAVPSIALTGGEAALRLEICQKLHEKHGITIVTDHAEPNPAKQSGPWVSPVVPPVLLDRSQPLEHESSDSLPLTSLPRLIGRIQRTTEKTRWPAPHQIWPIGSHWPEYRLEVDDLSWAVDELASAIDSMKCQLHPVTHDGNWWDRNL